MASNEELIALDANTAREIANTKTVVMLTGMAQSQEYLAVKQAISDACNRGELSVTLPSSSVGEVMAHYLETVNRFTVFIRGGETEIGWWSSS